MTSLKCGVCAAELVSGASFCRQCGSPTEPDTVPFGSETPTAVFGKTAENVTTQRLDPRPTTPDRGAMRLPQSASPMAIDTPAPGQTQRKGMTGGIILLLLIIGIVSAAVVVNRRTHPGEVGTTSQAPNPNAVLFYPGAKTIVDMTNTDGSRAIQLETAEPLDRVESWYQNNLKLTKTMRLTSASVVMKNEKVTITLANENNKTAILIKQRPD